MPQSLSRSGGSTLSPPPVSLQVPSFPRFYSNYHHSGVFVERPPIQRLPIPTFPRGWHPLLLGSHQPCRAKGRAKPILPVPFSFFENLSISLSRCNPYGFGASCDVGPAGFFSRAVLFLLLLTSLWFFRARTPDLDQCPKRAHTFSSTPIFSERTPPNLQFSVSLWRKLFSRNF